MTILNDHHKFRYVNWWLHNISFHFTTTQQKWGSLCPDTEKPEHLDMDWEVSSDILATLVPNNDQGESNHLILPSSSHPLLPLWNHQKLNWTSLANVESPEASHKPGILQWVIHWWLPKLTDYKAQINRVMAYPSLTELSAASATLRKLNTIHNTATCLIDILLILNIHWLHY